MDRGKILIVDDDEGLLQLIVKLLCRHGWDAFQASNEIKALKEIENNKPMLLLVDYQLQKVTGGQLIKKVQEKFGEIPFVVMTGYGDEKKVAEMFKYGARDYLVKDTNFLEQLPQVIEQVVEKIQKENLDKETFALLKNQAAIITFSEDAVIAMDLKGIIQYWNHAAEKIYGYSSAKAIGSLYLDLLSPQYREMDMIFFDILSAGDKLEAYETEHIQKGGVSIYVSVTLSSIYENDGRHRGFSAIVRDITEQKKAEQALRLRMAFENILMNASQTFFSAPTQFSRTMYTTLGKISQLIGADQAFLYWLSDNDEVCILYEWYKNINEIDLQPTSTIADHWKELAKQKNIVVALGNRQESTMENENSGFILIPMVRDEIYGFIIFECNVIAEEWLTRDWSFLKLSGDMFCNIITRQLAEKELADRQAQIINHQKVLLELYQEQFVKTEDKIEKICMLAAQTLLVDRVSILLFNEDITELVRIGMYQLGPTLFPANDKITLPPNSLFKKEIEKQRVILSGDIQNNPLFTDFKEDALFKNIKTAAFVTISSRGKVIGMVSYCNMERMRSWSLPEQEFTVSITDQVALSLKEESLRQTLEQYQLGERRYRALMEQSSDGILILNLNSWEVLEANVQAQSIFNVKDEGVVGKNLISLLGDRGHDAYQRMSDDSGQHQMICDYCQENGQTRVLEFRFSHISFDDYQWVMANIADITEKRLMEEKSRYTQKMEAVGTLAGGIAHDFNNILSAMMGYTELALRELPEIDRVQNHLQEVMHAGNRAKALIKQIMTFGRPTDNNIQQVDLKKVIHEVLLFLKATLPSNIKICQDVGDSDFYVKGEPTQLFQIIINLCINAEMAMRRTGGTLQIGLSKKKIEKEEAQFLQLLGEEYCLLIVSDTGIGMEPQVMNRIFEPFFTTKPQGEGTGMGLAVVHGLVKSYGGVIEVESKIEEGSKFTIYLPIVTEIAEVIPSTEKLKNTSHARILFVDDEEILVKLHVDALRRAGYFVTGASSGRAGKEIFLKAPNEFDLIITDQTMKDMTGEELALSIWTIRENIPIILCTGYSYLIDEERAYEVGFSAFLHKPISMEDMVHAIEISLTTQDHFPYKGPMKSKANLIPSLFQKQVSHKEWAPRQDIYTDYMEIVTRWWVHELKQPLSIISNITNMAAYYRKKGKLQSAAEYADEMEEVRRQVRRIESLLNSGVGYFQNPGQEANSKIDLQVTVQEILQLLNAYFIRNKVEIVFTQECEDLFIEVKPSSLKRAIILTLLELVENHMLSGGSENIFIILSLLTGPTLEFKVQDPFFQRLVKWRFSSYWDKKDGKVSVAQSEGYQSIRILIHNVKMQGERV
ncbi:response regulator [Pelosinus sp. sgz500959]|uniref:response regulator n=1 Tax=Pelosinus sp. sgz500959 TaxID=3242472 RepID=UPI0036730860